MPDPVGPINGRRSFDGNANPLRGYAERRLLRGFLLNLDTNDKVDFQFNPEQLEETYKARYANMEVFGLSHQPLHFLGNENAAISLDLVFDQVVAATRRGTRDLSETDGVTDIDQVRRTLVSFLYPLRLGSGVSASPSPILFSWPRMAAMRMRILSVNLKHTMFEVGIPRSRRYVAKVEMAEEPLARMYADSVKNQGMIRPWASVLPRGF
jgi:hypothetical protein